MATQITLTPSSTEVQIDWVHDNPSIGSGTTDIEVSDDGGINFSLAGQVISYGTTFTDTGLTPITEYIYRLRKVEWTCYSPEEGTTTL